LSWTKYSSGDEAKDCDIEVTSEVDVIISLYNFETYKAVLQRSLESCFDNPRIIFHFVLARPTPAELAWTNALIENTHHKLYRSDELIGVYAAWNLAIKGGSSEFITNLNADDLRLPHSICHQAKALEGNAADGSYGNFIISNDILGFIESPASDVLASNLGQFDEKKLLWDAQNFMHCAPMWRRKLHLKSGLFDETLKSSGDTDFWLRAMSEGAIFSLFPDQTAVYFHNPEGLSTSLISAGHREWTRIRNRELRRKALP
jgi:hypothetical protein